MNLNFLNELIENGSFSYYDKSSGLSSLYVEEKYPKEDIDELIKNGYIICNEDGYYITRKGVVDFGYTTILIDMGMLNKNGEIK